MSEKYQLPDNTIQIQQQPTVCLKWVLVNQIWESICCYIVWFDCIGWNSMERVALNVPTRNDRLRHAHFILQAFSCYQPPNQSLSNLQWCGLSFFPYQSIFPQWFNPRYRNCDKMYRHIARYRTTTAQKKTKTHNKQVEKLYGKLQNFCFHFVFFSFTLFAVLFIRFLFCIRPICTATFFEEQENRFQNRIKNMMNRAKIHYEISSEIYELRIRNQINERVCSSFCGAETIGCWIVFFSVGLSFGWAAHENMER